MDTFQMRKAVMDAIDVPTLVEEMKLLCDKPSHYTLSETSTIMKQAVMALTLLYGNYVPDEIKN